MVKRRLMTWRRLRRGAQGNDGHGSILDFGFRRRARHPRRSASSNPAKANGSAPRCCAARSTATVVGTAFMARTLAPQHAANFGSAASNEVAFILRNTTLETEVAPSIGRRCRRAPPTACNMRLHRYNWQWNEAVVGLDVGYSRLSSIPRRSPIRLPASSPHRQRLAQRPDRLLVVGHAGRLCDAARALWLCSRPVLPYAVLGARRTLQLCDQPT